MEGGDRHSADTESIHAGHDPRLHRGSIKPPIYETTTFGFESASEMERVFAEAYGLIDGPRSAELPYIYSRLDSPNLEAAEARVSQWENAETSLLFNSGMAAITTLMLTLLRPGDQILHSSPLYGGTAKLLNGLMSDLGVIVTSYRTDQDPAELATEDLSVVYVETPANPTNDIFDIARAAELAHSRGAKLVVDNTFLSPVWQRPLEHGADFSLHSATKYLGGHSDLTAGVISGSETTLEPVRHNRYRFGTTAQPATAWLLARSLETLAMRVTRQTETAVAVAAFLDSHESVTRVDHLSLLEAGDDRYEIYRRQCLGPGAMLAFEVIEGKEGAFRFLDSMEVISLATSLGGSDTLASHPGSTSHSTMSAEDRHNLGVTPGLIRLSIGLEDPHDLIADLSKALASI